jgi:hypothetical protein
MCIARSTCCKKCLRCPCMLHSPLSSYSIKLFRVVHEHAGNLGILWILRLGGAEEGLQGEESGFDC